MKQKPEDACTAITANGRALARCIDTICADAHPFDVVEILTRKLGEVLISHFPDYQGFHQGAWDIACHLEQIGRGHFKAPEPDSNVVEMSSLRQRRDDKV